MPQSRSLRRSDRAEALTLVQFFYEWYEVKTDGAKQWYRCYGLEVRASSRCDRGVHSYRTPFVGLDIRRGRPHEEAAYERKRRPHHGRGALVQGRRGRELVPHLRQALVNDRGTKLMVDVMRLASSQCIAMRAARLCFE